MLLCTGYADRPELIEAVEHGAVLLHKPFATATLLAQVDALASEVKDNPPWAPIDPVLAEG